MPRNRGTVLYAGFTVRSNPHLIQYYLILGITSCGSETTSVGHQCEACATLHKSYIAQYAYATILRPFLHSVHHCLDGWTLNKQLCHAGGESVEISVAWLIDKDKRFRIKRWGRVHSRLGLQEGQTILLDLDPIDRTRLLLTCVLTDDSCGAAAASAAAPISAEDLSIPAAGISIAEGEASGAQGTV